MSVATWLYNKYWLLRARLPQRQVEADCGHLTTKAFIFTSLSGRRFAFHYRSKTPECCEECFRSAIAQCARCSKEILPGDPITLYVPNKNFEIPAYAIRVSINGSQEYLVGCLRSGCGKVFDRAGFWPYPGIAHRVLSSAESVVSNGGVVTANDICDTSLADK